MNILYLESSIFADAGVSSQLAQEVLEGLEADHGTAKVTYRRFANDSIPHLDGSWMQALTTAEADRDDQQRAMAAYSDRLTAELQAADILVIGMPMYNFNVPSMLKAWFDHVARAGITFKYEKSGPVGLLRNKKAFVVTTRGGRYQNTAADSQVPFVQTFLKFLGIEDVNFVYAEGLNMGESAREQGLDSARQQIRHLLAA